MTTPDLNESISGAKEKAIAGDRRGIYQNVSVQLGGDLPSDAQDYTHAFCGALVQMLNGKWFECAKQLVKML